MLKHYDDGFLRLANFLFFRRLLYRNKKILSTVLGRTVSFNPIGKATNIVRRHTL